MARTILIEATPRDITGAAVNVYLAGGGSRGYDHRGRTSWKAGIAAEPKFSAAIGFSENGWTGAALPQTSRLRFFPADKATLTELASRQWVGAPFDVLIGDDVSAAPAWTTLLKGTVSAFAISAGAIEFTIADLSEKLSEPFLKDAKFLGTGAAEGDADVEGRIKRRSFGRVWNVEGRVLRKAQNVYEFSDPAFPLSAFVEVKDMGRAGTAGSPVAWAGSIAATLTALEASSPPGGGYCAAPSIACVKWWTQPSGPLTADIDGEIGAGYVDQVVAIGGRILGIAGGPAYAGNLAAGYRADQAGIHCEEASESTANLLDRLLLGASLTWVADPAGTIYFREFTFAAPVETITIEEAERVESYKPVTSRKLAYKRSYRKHTDGEISAAVLLADIDGAGDLAAVDYVYLGSPTIRDAGQANNLTESGTYGVRNNTVTIGAAGNLTGAGGGQVTPLGMGFEAGSVNSENLFRNGFIRLNADHWTIAGGTQTWTASAAGEPIPAHIHATATGTVNGNKPNLGELISCRGSETIYLSFWARGDLVTSNNCRIQYRIVFRNTAGGSLGATSFSKQIAVINTFEREARTYVTPAGSATIEFQWNPEIGAGATFIDAGGFRLARSEEGSTLGAAWTSNVTARPANLAALSGSEGVNNNLVSISAGGALSGGGGGTVTVTGLGYAGALADLDSASYASLLNIFDDGVVTSAEKSSTLIPLYNALEAAYTELVARGTALSLSTSAATTARTNYLASLNALSPAWDNSGVDSSWPASLFSPDTFPTNWTALSGATTGASGNYTTVTDPGASLSGLRRSISNSGVNSYSIGFYVDKDATGKATRHALLRLTGTAGTSKTADARFDTATGEIASASSPDEIGIVDVGADWFIFNKITTNSDNTGLTVDLYPAAGTNLGANANATTGSINARSPILVSGSVDNLGRPLFIYRHKAYRAALDQLFKAISEEDAKRAIWGTTITSRPANLAALSGSEGINNVLVTLSAGGALAGGGGGSIAYDSLADGSTYAKILAAELTSGAPKRTVRLDTTGVGIDSRVAHSNFGLSMIPTLKDAVTISDTDNTGTVTINIGAANYYPDYGGIVTFPSGTSAGKAYGTKYYIKRTGVHPINSPTGSAWNVATTLSVSTGEVYIGTYVTRASGGAPSPPPPPPPGGGGDCIGVDMWLGLADGSVKRASEVRAGDRLLALDYATLDSTNAAIVTGVSFACVPCQRTSVNSGGLINSLSTPMTLRDGSIIDAPRVLGCDLPVQDQEGFGWRTVVSIEDVGKQWVARIHAGGATFAAGEDPAVLIFTHNPSKP